MKLKKSIVGLVVLCLILSLSAGMASAATIAYDTQQTVTYTLTCQTCGQQSTHDVTFYYHVYTDGTWQAYAVSCPCNFDGEIWGSNTFYFRHECYNANCGVIIQRGSVPSPF